MPIYVKSCPHPAGIIVAWNKMVTEYHVECYR